jgi:hypothetical protein
MEPSSDLDENPKPYSSQTAARIVGYGAGRECGVLCLYAVLKNARIDGGRSTLEVFFVRIDVNPGRRHD